MEFSDNNNYVKEFFERTIYNLKLYGNENKLCKERFQYEVTQLVNSLLGLVIFVKEDDINFNAIKISDIINIDDITWKYCDRNGGILEEKNFSNFLRHIRNAIAHKRLSIKSRNKEITSMVFKDFQRKNIFEVELDINKITTLVQKLSECIGK